MRFGWKDRLLMVLLLLMLVVLLLLVGRFGIDRFQFDDHRRFVHRRWWYHRILMECIGAGHRRVWLDEMRLWWTGCRDINHATRMMGGITRLTDLKPGSRISWQRQLMGMLLQRGETRMYVWLILCLLLGLLILHVSTECATTIVQSDRCRRRWRR